MSGAINIDQDFCLNHNYRQMECRRCANICPHSCFDEALAVDDGRCSDCGLCLAACPVSAVTGGSFRAKPVEAALKDTASPLLIACQRQLETSDWPCLGFLDGRLLLALVYSGQDGNRAVVIDDRTCVNCRAGVGQHLAATIAATNEVLVMSGKIPIERRNAAVEIHRRPKAISRRAFFAELFGATVETVREVVAAEVGKGERLPRQEWFLPYAALGGKTERPTTLFTNLAIDGKCQACGLCLKVCPTRALTAKDYGDRLEFYHQPARCTGCGVCAIHCSQEALTLANASKLEQYVVTTTTLPRCSSCGELFQPIGGQPVCLECLLKGKPDLLL